MPDEEFRLLSKATGDSERGAQLSLLITKTHDAGVTQSRAIL